MTKADSPKPPTKLETITLKVFIHCEGCRRKVRRIIRVIDGVEDVTVDSASGKVTVTGAADAKTIMQRLHKYGKHAEMWPSPNPAPPPTAQGKAGGNQSKPNNNNGSDSNNKKNSTAGGEGGDKAAAAVATENGSKKGEGKKEATASAAVKGLDNTVNEVKPEKGQAANSEEAINGTQKGGGGGGGGSGGGGVGGGGGKKGGKKGGNGNTTSSGNGNNNGGGGGNGNNNGGGAGNGNPQEVPSLVAPAVHEIPIMNAPDTSVMVTANKSLAPYDSIQTGFSYHSAEYATHMFSDENANNCSIM